MSGLCHTIDAGKRHWLGTRHRHGLANLHNGSARLELQLSLPRQRPLSLAAAASGHASTDAPITGPQVILDRYRAMLHEYRAHKASLGDWITGVRAQHKRQPQLLDAEATGDAALISRFQQYLMARKRLLAEIPLLREQLAESIEQQHQHQQSASSSNYQQHKRPSSNSSGQGSLGVVNANKVSVVSKPQAVGQFFAAVNYRKQQGLRTDHGSSSSSSVEQHTAAGAAEQAVPAVLGSEQVTVTAVLPTADSSSSSTTSSSTAGANSPAAAAAVTSAKNGAVSHLLESATSSSNASTGSSRAAAAALAALNYRKQKQGGGAAAGDSLGSWGPQQQRPLAVQLAAPPRPPPGYAADGTRLADGGSTAAAAAVVGTVETATGDVYAGRLKRQLDADTSLEATLQGVPGGLGSTAGGPIFAMAKAVQADAVATAAASEVVASSSSAADSAVFRADDAVLAAAAQEAAATNVPVGQVVTAKFDVYSGRQRKLDPNTQLDDFFASIEQGHSSQLAAAAAVSASRSNSGGTGSSSSSSSRGVEGSATKAPARKQANTQRRTGFSMGDGGLLDMGMPDMVPLPP